MSSDGELAVYLRALEETDKEDLVTEERERRRAKRESRVEADLDGMDIDDDETTGVCQLAMHLPLQDFQPTQMIDRLYRQCKLFYKTLKLRKTPRVTR